MIFFDSVISNLNKKVSREKVTTSATYSSIKKIMQCKQNAFHKVKSQKKKICGKVTLIQKQLKVQIMYKS